jgi:hypothetical protein
MPWNGWGPAADWMAARWAGFMKVASAMTDWPAASGGRGVGGEGGEDAGADVGRVGARGGAAVRGDGPEALADFVAAQDGRARGGAEARGEGAGDGGFAGALQAADGDELGRAGAR